MVYTYSVSRKWSWVDYNFIQPTNILSVLVVATPCSLIFATPIAIMSGINRASKMGIIVKSGAVNRTDWKSSSSCI